MGYDKTTWTELDDMFNDESGGESPKQKADELAENDGSFDLLPVDDYDVEVEEFLFTQLGENGTLALTMTFRIINGKYTGRKFWHTFWLTQKALPYTCNNVRIITGIKVKNPSELKEIRFIGERVSVHSKHVVSEKDGNTYANIQYFNPISMEAATTGNTEDDDDIPF